MCKLPKRKPSGNCFGSMDPYVFGASDLATRHIAVLRDPARSTGVRVATMPLSTMIDHLVSTSAIRASPHASVVVGDLHNGPLHLKRRGHFKLRLLHNRLLEQMCMLLPSRLCQAKIKLVFPVDVVPVS